MRPQDIHIERASDIPIADQIAGQILKAILQGDLPSGARLLPERELAEALGLSRGTVKRAYAKLCQAQAIELRQGSGSYVLTDSNAMEQNQKREAAAIIASSLRQLRGLGLSEEEIQSLFALQTLYGDPGRAKRLMILVVSNNHEILSQLEQQLSYLSEVPSLLYTLSYMTLDTIARSGDPVQLLLGYDLIIASAIDYASIMEMSPLLAERTMQALLEPRARTMVRLSTLPAKAKVAVIYRTPVFRDMVVKSLRSLNFRPHQILTFHERDYNPAHHADNGVVAILNFNESPLYTNEAFTARNREFTAGGGVILRYEYQIERGTLMAIEERIRKLAQQRLR